MNVEHAERRDRRRRSLFALFRCLRMVTCVLRVPVCLLPLQNLRRPSMHVKEGNPCCALAHSQSGVGICSMDAFGSFPDPGATIALCRADGSVAILSRDGCRRECVCVYTYIYIYICVWCWFLSLLAFTWKYHYSLI